jgi:hypothetical protein
LHSTGNARRARGRSRTLSRAGALLGAAAVLVLAGCGGSAGSQGAQPAQPAPGRTSAPGSPAPQTHGSRYISFTSYPGWIQASIPPGKFNFAPWTVISDFGLWPTRTGGIAVGDMQSLSYIPRAVAAAHRAGKTIIMAVGEEGLGPNFAAGASPGNRSRLISSIITDVRKYHFDGVDIDWEEEVPQNQADYVALLADLRPALDKAFPGRNMFLSTDVNTGQIPPDIAARVAPYVDTVNVESFRNNGASSIAAYIRAGIPAGKLLLGIGVAHGYYDTTESRVAAKVKYVEQHGLKGTLLWQPGNLHSDRTDQRLIPLRQMLRIRG